MKYFLEGFSWPVKFLQALVSPTGLKTLGFLTSFYIAICFFAWVDSKNKYRDY